MYAACSILFYKLAARGRIHRQELLQTLAKRMMWFLTEVAIVLWFDSTHMHIAHLALHIAACHSTRNLICCLVYAPLCGSIGLCEKISIFQSVYYLYFVLIPILSEHENSQFWTLLRETHTFIQQLNVKRKISTIIELKNNKPMLAVIGDLNSMHYHWASRRRFHFTPLGRCIGSACNLPVVFYFCVFKCNFS